MEGTLGEGSGRFGGETATLGVGRGTGRALRAGAASAIQAAAAPSAATAMPANDECMAFNLARPNGLNFILFSRGLPTFSKRGCQVNELTEDLLNRVFTQ